jgi:hypothetical protein
MNKYNLNLYISMQRTRNMIVSFVPKYYIRGYGNTCVNAIVEDKDNKCHNTEFKTTSRLTI